MKQAGLIAVLLFIAVPATAQPPTFTDDFSRYAEGSDGSPTWKPFLGTWVVKNGRFHQTGSTAYDQGASLDLKPTGQFVISVKTRAEGGATGGGLFFNMQSRDNRNNCQMVRVDPEMVLYGYEDAKGDFQPTGVVNTTLDNSREYTLSVVVDNDLGAYSVLLDGKVVGRNAPLRFYSGYVGLQSSLANSFDDFSVRLPTAEELATLTPAEPFNGPRAIVWGPGARIFVGHRGANAVAVVDPMTGAVERTFAPRGRGEGRVLDPASIRIDGDRNVWILDPPQGRIAVFREDGTFSRSVAVDPSTVDFVLLPSSRLDAGAPGAWPVTKTLGIVTLRPDALTLLTPEGRGVSNVGPLKSATCLTLDPAGRLLVGDPGDQVIRVFAVRGEAIEPAGTMPGWLNPRSLAVNSKGNLVFLGSLGYYETGGAVRETDVYGKRVSHFAGFAIGGIGQNGAIALGPDDTVYMADADNNRIVVIPPGLPEPQPRVDVTDTSATLTWQSHVDGGDAAVSFGTARDNLSTPPFIVFSGDTHGARRARLWNLKPDTAYWYTFTPSVRTIPATPTSKLYTFRTAPERGRTSYVTLKVITAIYLKTDNAGKKFAARREEVGDRIRLMMERARDFYWRNTGFRLNLDIEYAVIEDAEADIREAIPPVEQVKKDIAASADFAGKDIRNYDSVIATWLTPNYSKDQQEQPGRVGGGGLTPYGYSAFAADGMVAWLMVHEYNHQVDAFFDRAGLPEFWLNHPDTTVHPGRYGGQYDCNAFIFREWPDNDWFALPANGVGRVCIAADRDNDGLPDNDPRVPLDERRFGSSASKADTDGDGLSDRAEAMAGIFGGSNPRSRDTDRDGVVDAKDPWPLDAAAQARPRKTPNIDGILSPDEWTPLAPIRGSRLRGETFLNWDENGVYIAARVSEPCTLEIHLTPENGALFGDRKLEMRVNAQDASAGGGPVPVSQGKGSYALAKKGADGSVVIEVAVPRNPSIGLAPQMYQAMGLGLQFYNRNDWTSVFEPWRLWEFRLMEPNAR
jgi:hypothetical protein